MQSDKARTYNMTSSGVKNSANDKLNVEELVKMTQSNLYNEERHRKCSNESLNNSLLNNTYQYNNSSSNNNNKCFPINISTNTIQDKNKESFNNKTLGHRIQELRENNKIRYSKLENHKINSGGKGNNYNYAELYLKESQFPSNNSTKKHNQNKINSISNNQNFDDKTAQLNEESEMQKLLNYEKEYEKRKNVRQGSKKNSFYFAEEGKVRSVELMGGDEAGKDGRGAKDIKEYIDDKISEVKFFIHDEMNSLRVDLIRQFELDRTKNLTAISELMSSNNQLLGEIEKLRRENAVLKAKLLDK